MKKSEMAVAIVNARIKKYPFYDGDPDLNAKKLARLPKSELEKIYSAEVTGQKKLYVCYGSNLHIAQMAHRCPDATIYGSGVIKNYRLKFYGVASIEPQSGEDCPVGVWEISGTDEINLDRYEGFPHLYRKENVDVVMEGGETVSAMVYIMNRSGAEYDPSPSYYETIYSGYQSFGLPVEYLEGCALRVKNSSPAFGSGHHRHYPYY